MFAAKYVNLIVKGMLQRNIEHFMKKCVYEQLGISKIQLGISKIK